MTPKEIKSIIRQADLLDIVQIHTKSKRGKETKSLFVLYHNSIIYLVHFTRVKERFFLKNIIPTKKTKQLYQKKIEEITNSTAEPTPEILVTLKENTPEVEALNNACFIQHPAYTECKAYITKVQQTPNSTTTRSFRMDTAEDEKARKIARKMHLTYNRYINIALKHYNQQNTAE